MDGLETLLERFVDEALTLIHHQVVHQESPSFYTTAQILIHNHLPVQEREVMRDCLHTPKAGKIIGRNARGDTPSHQRRSRDSVIYWKRHDTE